MHINIEEILGKHCPNFKLAKEYGRQKKALITAEQAKAAIKEIVEAVIDKCAEEAKLIKIGGGVSVDKFATEDSILNVKKIIDYD